jgi:predicted nucleotidyltransferase
VASSSLDLSDRAVLGSLARLLSAVRRAAGDTPLLLVGAAAHDLLLVHVHGVEAQRATEDTDLALAVRSWEASLRLRDALITSGGFTVDGPHRFWFGDQRLDIIPFGGVERPDRNIAWPTESAEVMSVAGLTEALATAVAVQLPGGVSIDVAPLPALALLKIWAWTDRRSTAPGKDASDIWMFLRHYAHAGQRG